MAERAFAKPTWFAGICAVGLLATTSGLTCFPAAEEPGGSELDFGISVARPAEDVFLADDNPAEIRWSDFGLPAGGATVRVWVDPDEEDDNGNEILLAERDAAEDGDADVIFWEGLDADGDPVAPGVYRVIAELDDGAGQTDRRQAPGRVILPLQWQAPAADVDLPAGGSLTFQWNQDDASVDFLGLMLDTDEDFNSGNEIPITSTDSQELNGEFVFDGFDEHGDPVPAGTYRLVAMVGNSSLAEFLAYQAPGQVTVPEIGPPTISLLTASQEDESAVIGSNFTIEWTDSDPDSDAQITLGLDEDDTLDNGNEIVIAEGLSEDADGADGSFDWDLTDADGGAIDPGIYRIWARIDDGRFDAAEAVSENYLFIRPAANGPVIRLLGPSGPLTVNAGETVEFSWIDDDPDSNATIDILLDDDANPENGSPGETVVATTDEDPDGAGDSLSWTVAGVAPGTYFFYARISDGASQMTSPGTLTITVANTTPTLTFTEPAALTESDLAGAAPITISWNDADPDATDNALIQLGIDVDQDHNNGNEIFIRRDIDEDPDGADDSINWDLTDADGNAVPTGVYFVFGIISDGRAQPQIAEAPGRVLVRQTANAPLIELETLTGETMITPGRLFTISWFDDDPDDDAQIKIIFDDDPDPLDDVNAPLQVILAGRSEDPDGAAQDSVVWIVPGPLDPATTYYVHALIDQDGDNVFEDTSTSGPLQLP